MATEQLYGANSAHAISMGKISMGGQNERTTKRLP